MTELVQPLDVAPIKARVDAATPGDWGWYDGSDYADVIADYQSTGPGSYSCRQQIARIEADSFFDDPAHEDADEADASEQAMADADFIAHARQDVPALITEVLRLRDELTTARAATFREAARLLEDTGRDDDAVNLLDNIAEGITANTPA